MEEEKDASIVDIEKAAADAAAEPAFEFELPPPFSE